MSAPSAEERAALERERETLLALMTTGRWPDGRKATLTEEVIAQQRRAWIDAQLNPPPPEPGR